MSDSVPWWGWLVLWSSLVLVALVGLGLFAWWIFRKFLRLVEDAADLAARAEVLEFDMHPLPEPAIAVLATARDIKTREDARKAHRAYRTRQRHADRMARAKRITSLDATRVKWPTNWYHS